MKLRSIEELNNGPMWPSILNCRLFPLSLYAFIAAERRGWILAHLIPTL